jgi:hypothetical protein
MLGDYGDIVCYVEIEGYRIGDRRLVHG